MKIRVLLLLGVLCTGLFAGATSVSVVTSSISNGLTFPSVPLNLTEVVVFNTPLDTSSFTASDFDLLDPASQSVTPASFSFDATGTIFTANYANLNTPGTYEFEVLHADPIPGNLFGITPLSSPFEVTFYLVHPGTQSVPEPSSVLLLGSGLLAAGKLAIRHRRR